MEYNKICNQDCLEGIKQLPDASIDCILTDPPYLYLKGQKLERPFDELELFKQCKRVLKKGGFVVLFGRGTSFYRWNTILADLGFEFKEEIVWDKIRNSIPAAPLMRVHELVVIYAKDKKQSITRAYVPYIEQKSLNIESIAMDLKRIKSALNTKELDELERFLSTGEIQYREKTSKSFFKRGYGSNSKAVDSLKSIKNGMVERSIITAKKEQSTTIHPTQKPVRLLERLLALVTKPGDIVLDPFSGSGSTAIACINSGRQFIGFEIDEEYYDLSVQRIAEYHILSKKDQLNLF